MEDLDILLIEDNPMDAHLVLRMLQKEQISEKVHWLKDGEAALNYMSENESLKPKVVLLDIKLPKVMGLEVLKKLKENLQWNTIPVVMLSSSDRQQDIDKAYSLMANAYCVKKSNFAEYQNELRTTLMFWTKINKHFLWS